VQPVQLAILGQQVLQDKQEEQGQLAQQDRQGFQAQQGQQERMVRLAHPVIVVQLAQQALREQQDW